MSAHAAGRRSGHEAARCPQQCGHEGEGAGLKNEAFLQGGDDAPTLRPPAHRPRTKLYTRRVIQPRFVALRRGALPRVNAFQRPSKINNKTQKQNKNEKKKFSWKKK